MPNPQHRVVDDGPRDAAIRRHVSVNPIADGLTQWTGDQLLDAVRKRRFIGAGDSGGQLGPQQIEAAKAFAYNLRGRLTRASADLEREDGATEGDLIAVFEQRLVDAAAIDEHPVDALQID